MENEMLNKILEEIKSLKTEMNERFKAIDKRFEDIDNKFEGKFEELNEKFEGLNEKFEKHLIEFEEFKEQFKRHDEGVKSAWEKFENVIGEEFKKVHDRLDKISVKIKFLEMGMQEIYLMHNKQFNLAEDDEHYRLFKDTE